MFPNTRSSRSRLSSPQQQQQQSHAVANSDVENVRPTLGGIEGQKAFMQRWLEPPPISRPSFQDAGLMRAGVVEGMAALGTLPKASAAAGSKKLAATGAAVTTAAQQAATHSDQPAQRKIVFTRGTDTSTNLLRVKVPQRSGSQSPPPALPLPSRRGQAAGRGFDDDDDDDDYEPDKAALSSSSYNVGRRNLSRHTSARANANSPFLQSPLQAKSSKMEAHDSAEKVVQNAVDEALHHFRYPTAWALRTLYDENQHNPQFLSMIEAIYQQTADPDTVEEFARLIHEKKKEGKRDNKGCYYFVPPTTNSRFTPHKPKPAPYGNLIKSALLNFGSESESPLGKRSKKDGPGRDKMDQNGVNGDAHQLSSPERKRKRRTSLSSDSSLSSAVSVESLDDFPDSRRDSVALAETVSGGGTHASTSTRAGDQPPQPIAKRRKTQPAKDVSLPPPSRPVPSSPTHPTLAVSSRTAGGNGNGATASSTMSAAAAADHGQPFPNLAASSKQLAAPIKFQPRYGGYAEEPEPRARLRRQARENSERNEPYVESFTRGTRRGTVGPDATSVEMGDAPTTELAGAASSSPRVQPSRAARLSSAASTFPNLRTTRQGKKSGPQDDAVDDTPVSPTTTAPRLSAPPPPGAGEVARPDTPTQRPGAARKLRTGPRIKTSPMKKKTNTSAGMPRPSGERVSPGPNGTTSTSDENDDYCTSCGGGGELLCCDGCTRSFHFECVDPPLDKDKLPEDWYCNACFAARYPHKLPDHDGPFGEALNKLERKLPMAFSLPQSIREYFEGVLTGADGEYEEPPVVKPKNKKGYEEAPDFFKLRESDGTPVICNSCNKSATDNRAIIMCSRQGCGLYWHLDCLDPPLSNPPVVRTWECPAHTEDLLAVHPSVMGPAHRVRRIKNARPIVQAFKRGMKNNGLIEVVHDDNEDSEWEDYEEFGRTYRLSAKGIKLDFISRLREEGMGYIDPQKRKRALEAKADLEQEPKRARPTLKADTQPTLDEMEVALTLSHMPVETSAMDRLIQAIQQGASPLMLSLIAKADASNIASRKLTDNDRQALLGLQALIKDILGSQDAATKENPQQVNVQNEQQQLSPQSLATGDVGDGDKIVSLVDSTQEITDVELPDAVSLASPEVADTQTEMATDTPVAVGQNGGADAADNQLSSPAEDTKPAQQEAGDAQGLAGLRSPEQAQTASEDVADITMDDVTPEKKAEPAPVVAKDTSIELAAQRAVTSSPNIKAEPEMDASVIEKAAPSSGENVPSSAVDQMDESKVNGTEKVPAIIVEPAETPSGVDKKGEMEGVS